MTAHELAKKLLDGPDLLVTVRGYEGGVNEINNVSKPSILQLNTHDEWYYGKHEYLGCAGDKIEEDYHYDATKQRVQAIQIG